MKRRPKTNSLLCAQRLRLDGFNIDSKELELRVTNNDLSLIENAVLKAGLAMPVCYEYELVEFCAGNQCDEPGVSFLLRKQN